MDVNSIEAELRVLCHVIAKTNNCTGINCNDCPLQTEEHFIEMMNKIEKDY